LRNCSCKKSLIGCKLIDQNRVFKSNLKSNQLVIETLLNWNVKIKNYVKDDRLWLLSGLAAIAMLYLNLIWKTTENIDQLTTSGFYWGAIIWLLWRRRDSLRDDSEPCSSLLGLLLMGLVSSKTLNLFSFESTLLPLLPLGMAIALALIASGFSGFSQYRQELFFAWFLFFPEGVIGHWLDSIVHITLLNAKFATYFLYYLGFNVASQGNQVLLSLPELGEFKAIVDYPCAGVPMILLMLKFALLLISIASLSRREKLLIPAFSVILGFLLGVVRVVILTLLIPNPTQFGYWHGAQGSQIFSTLAITIFAGFCYWILEKKSAPTARLRGKKHND
jgi:cyanoexosortase A